MQAWNMHCFIPDHYIHSGLPQESDCCEVICSSQSNAGSCTQSILPHMHTIMQVHHVLNIVLFQGWYIHHFEDSTPIVSTIQSTLMIWCIMGLAIFLQSNTLHWQLQYCFSFYHSCNNVGELSITWEAFACSNHWLKSIGIVVASHNLTDISYKQHIYDIAEGNSTKLWMQDANECSHNLMSVAHKVSDHHLCHQ